LCDEPLVGTSQPSGSAEDGKSRLYGWRFLGAFGKAVGVSRGRLGEGGPSAKPPRGCHAEKGRFAGATQPILARLGGVPDVAQLTTVRIGDVVLAALPAEITTMAGELLRDSIRAGLGTTAPAPRHIGIVSLTNGYMQYVTTAAEYAAQHYEGGSVLYGPGTAGVLAATLRALVAASASTPVPAVRIWP
jgi:neutral ceramidase